MSVCDVGFVFVYINDYAWVIRWRVENIICFERNLYQLQKLISWDLIECKLHHVKSEHIDLKHLSYGFRPNLISETTQSSTMNKWTRSLRIITYQDSAYEVVCEVLHYIFVHQSSINVGWHSIFNYILVFHIYIYIYKKKNKKTCNLPRPDIQQDSSCRAWTTYLWFFLSSWKNRC